MLEDMIENLLRTNTNFILIQLANRFTDHVTERMTNEMINRYMVFIWTWIKFWYELDSTHIFSWCTCMFALRSDATSRSSWANFTSMFITISGWFWWRTNSWCSSLKWKILISLLEYLSYFFGGGWFRWSFMFTSRTNSWGAASQSTMATCSRLWFPSWFSMYT